MFWRLQPSHYEAAFRRRSLENRSGGPNKGAMKQLVSRDAVPRLKAPSVDPYTGYDTMFAHAGFRLVRPGRGRGRALWQKDV